MNPMQVRVKSIQVGKVAIIKFIASRFVCLKPNKMPSIVNLAAHDYKLENTSVDTDKNLSALVSVRSSIQEPSINPLYFFFQLSWHKQQGRHELTTRLLNSRVYYTNTCRMHTEMGKTK